MEGWLEPRPAPALVRIECSIDRSKETGSLVIEDAQRNLRLKLLYWGSFEYTWRDRSANVKRFEIRWNDGDVTREGWGALGMVDSLRMDASGRVRLAFTIHEFDLTSPLRGCDMDPKRLGVTWVEIEHCTFQ